MVPVGLWGTLEQNHLFGSVVPFSLQRHCMQQALQREFSFVIFPLFFYSGEMIMSENGELSWQKGNAISRSSLLDNNIKVVAKINVFAF